MKKKLLIGLFLFLPVTGQCLTLSQVRTNSRLLIKDPSATRQKYTDTQMNSFINEAQRDVVNNTWAISKSTSITLVIGTTYYSLPTDTIDIVRVTFQRRNLPESALIQLDGTFNNGAWENSGGTPINYFQDPTQSNKVGFYPWPSTAASTGTVRMMYTAQATDLSSDSDIPFNSESRWVPYHDLLEYFVAYRVYLLEGENDKATVYRQEYEARLALMRGRINSKGNYNPSISGISGR